MSFWTKKKAGVWSLQGSTGSTMHMETKELMLRKQMFAGHSRHSETQRGL